MDALNGFADKLGGWAADMYGLLLVIAAALFVILVITFIVCGVKSAKNKKKLKNAENGATNDAEKDQAIASLTAEVNNKQKTIDELELKLKNAESNAGDAQNDLYRQLNELNQENKELESENNRLKAENAQIKAQALQQQIAETNRPARSREKAETTATADKPVQRAKTVKQKEPEPEPIETETEEDEDNEYDEYYDDYGDENSAVKVTVKFDRPKNNWVVLRSDTEKTYRRLGTKQEALIVGKDLARRLHAQLVVHKKDGKFQKV